MTVEQLFRIAIETLMSHLGVLGFHAQFWILTPASCLCRHFRLQFLCDASGLLLYLKNEPKKKSYFKIWAENTSVSSEFKTEVKGELKMDKKELLGTREMFHNWIMIMFTQLNL